MIRAQFTPDEAHVGLPMRIAFGEGFDWDGDAVVTAVREDGWVDFEYTSGPFAGLRGTAIMGRRTASGSLRW